MKPKQYPEQHERHCSVGLRDCQGTVFTGYPEKTNLICFSCAHELNRRRWRNEGYHE